MMLVIATEKYSTIKRLIFQRMMQKAGYDNKCKCLFNLEDEDKLFIDQIDETVNSKFEDLIYMNDL